MVMVVTPPPGAELVAGALVDSWEVEAVVEAGTVWVSVT